MSRYLNTRTLTFLVTYWMTLVILIPSRHEQAVLSVAVFCILPLILSALQLFFVGTWFPHHLNKKDPNCQTPRSLTIHPLLSFAACYHFGYHREHHLSLESVRVRRHRPEHSRSSEVPTSLPVSLMRTRANSSISSDDRAPEVSLSADGTVSYHFEDGLREKIRRRVA